MRLMVSFEENSSVLNINFVQTQCHFNVDFGEVVFVRENNVYDGDYNVIPRVYQQVLETRDKLMLDNVTVEVIPLTKVLNSSNGYTATIG